MKNTKWLLGILISLFSISIYSVNFVSAKDSDKTGAEKFGWHLSGAVMPVPPYGSLDIPNSDTQSKLIVNQPRCGDKTLVTGDMKGLAPNTTYTVYLSKGYTKYSPASILGDWKWTVLNTYVHDITINTQNTDGTFLGIGSWPSGATVPETTEVITGKMTGNSVTLTTLYNGTYNPGYTVTATGTINSDGSVSGNSPWSWTTTPNTVKLASGSTGWPGLLTDAVQPLTFTTDSTGVGTWHLNFNRTGLVGPFSVWINGGGATILISDNVNFKPVRDIADCRAKENDGDDEEENNDDTQEDTEGKDDCKKDGWKTFNNPVFKNQGQCVSHFESKRK